MKNLIEVLNARSIDSTSFVEFYKGEKLSYKEILEKSQVVATHLKKIGIKKGDRVGLILPTGSHFYFAFFGVQLLGGVPFALFPPMRLTDFSKWRKNTLNLIKIAKAKTVITEGRINLLIKDSLNIKDLTAGPRESTISFFPDESSEAFVQFSSGTTGTPKLISITHKNIMANCKSIIKAFRPYHQNTLTVSWLPLYHDMGLIGGMLTPMVADTSLILIPPEIFIARPLTWPEVISKRKAEISIAPNFAYGLCTKKILDEEVAKLDLSSWKVALCGAETVVPKTMDDFSNKFKKANFDPLILTPVYGLAEATLAVSFSDILKPMKWTEFDQDLLEISGIVKEKKDGIRIYSVGRPLENVSLSIRDLKGNEQGLKVGVIWVMGPNVGDGKNWISTGDRGFIFKDELYICGRDKEIIIIRGRNIDPSTIERPINELIDVRSGSTVALGILDQKHETERLYILAETKKSTRDQKLKDEIIQAAFRETGLRPDKVILLPPKSLPKTSSGKIKRLEAKKLIKKRWPEVIRQFFLPEDEKKVVEKLL